MVLSQSQARANVYDLSPENTERLKQQGYQRVELIAEIKPVHLRQDETLMGLLREIAKFPRDTAIEGVTTSYNAKSKHSKPGSADISIQGKECRDTYPQQNHSYIITFNSRLITRAHLEELALQTGGKLT